ncbi:MAG: hypothetical protein CMJ39_09470 [Phycisphaerae bacterium]|nr:hypothetical protein [Phycisphaerae bacterium]
MNWDEFNKNNEIPIGTNSESAIQSENRLIRLTQVNRLHRLVLDGLTGWQALTAIAAVMESPQMEVLLGLDTGLQVPPALASEIDPTNIPLRYAACVDGPIEDLDASAIEQAVISGSCMLTTDIRAVAGLISRGGCIEIESRTQRPLLAVIAEMLRRYMARRIRCDHNELPLPDAEIIDLLISRTGNLSIRSIETEIYPSFIDMGIAFPESDDIGPATGSVVFDRTSRTWHTD